MKRNEIADLPQLVQKFLNYQTVVKGKSQLTILEYGSDLRTFFRYILQKKDIVEKNTEFDEIEISHVDIDIIKNISISDIYDFLVFCQFDRENSAKTRARKTSTIRMFFKYLTVHEHILEVNPAQDLDSPNVRKSLPKFLSLEQSQNLLDNIDGQFFERDYCIITLFLNCGLRLSELVGLNVNSINSDGSVKVLGKGNKERIVYLNDACKEAVEKYLAVRPNDGVKDKKALFISRQKNRISPKTVQFIVKKFLHKAGINEDGFSVHKLRHTAATLMYQYGNVDVLLLKEILGHESLSTTQIYTHVANEQIRSAIDSNPLAGKKEKKPKPKPPESD